MALGERQAPPHCSGLGGGGTSPRLGSSDKHCVWVPSHHTSIPRPQGGNVMELQRGCNVISEPFLAEHLLGLNVIGMAISCYVQVDTTEAHYMQHNRLCRARNGVGLRMVVCHCQQMQLSPPRYRRLVHIAGIAHGRMWVPGMQTVAPHTRGMPDAGWMPQAACHVFDIQDSCILACSVVCSSVPWPQDCLEPLIPWHSSLMSLIVLQPLCILTLPLSWCIPCSVLSPSHAVWLLCVQAVLGSSLLALGGGGTQRGRRGDSVRHLEYVDGYYKCSTNLFTSMLIA